MFNKHFAVYEGLYIESTMTLDQKEEKQILTYDLDFAFLMRHEYHRRDTRTVVGGFLHVSQSHGVSLKVWRAIYGLQLYLSIDL